MPFRLVHIILLLVAFAGTGEVWGQEEGLASYYHNRFHGRKAASGRVHDADELVAAHRTYPFGTFLRVTNLANMLNRDWGNIKRMNSSSILAWDGSNYTFTAPKWSKYASTVSTWSAMFSIRYTFN